MKILIKIKLFFWKLFHKNFEKQTKDLVCFIYGNATLPQPLDSEEELLMIEEAQNGNSVAREKLIEHNLRLVVFIAKKFETCGIELDDLVSIGAIGLIKAVKTYSFDKNIKLATYASRCIENEILMQIRKNSRKKAEMSLDEPLSNDGDGNELLLADILSTEDDSVSRNIELCAEKKILLSAVEKLERREQAIMFMRFGLDGSDEKTQKEVADIMGISQSYISRIEKKILAKLKKKLQQTAEI